MKYKQGQEIIIVLGKLTGERGWIIENNNPGWKNSGMPYLVGLDSGSGEHMSEEYLMSLDELQQLRAENERLKTALQKVQAIADTLYQDAPDENVPSLLYYVSAMTHELKDAIHEHLP